MVTKVPRIYKRWIANRDQNEFGQAVEYVSQQAVPQWTLNHHEHRQELTNIMHRAVDGVQANKIRPRTLGVSAEILEVSAHRARLIKTKHREELQAKRHDVCFCFGREATHPTHVDLDTVGPFR